MLRDREVDAVERDHVAERLADAADDDVRRRDEGRWRPGGRRRSSFTPLQSYDDPLADGLAGGSYMRYRGTLERLRGACQRAAGARRPRSIVRRPV